MRTELDIAVKGWTSTSLKHRASGDIAEFRLGLFEGPKWEPKFELKWIQQQSQRKQTFGDLVLKLEDIHEGFMQTSRTLWERIATLKTERMNLMLEI